MTNSNRPGALESGAPQGNSDAFRRALGHFSTGVTIITAESDGVRAGITANSFNSVSLDPPLVLWSVKKTSTSWPIFAAAKSFAINVLASDQAQLASQFAKSGTDKFKDVDWEPGATGAPLLAGVTAQFECARRAEYEGGDHLIVVGEVSYFARYERRPLVFSQGRFSLAIDNVDAAPTNADQRGDQYPTFLTMFRRAFLQRASEFREEAHSVGFTMNESRLMYHLELSPGLSLEGLARVSLLDLDTATDGIASLERKEWIGRGSDGSLQLTVLGLEQNAKLGRLAHAAEANKLMRFSAAQISKTREIIEAFGGRLDNIPAYREPE
ncbi:flavin reductase family protein [Bradyrhizobium sp. UNPF46]|uniref:flavin reductase family protein n=1 Tax=Bradyrhizobium sp. UNPF46 TaxID=1141168 RepID=UPI0015F0A28B|nr:flavin reductase family protein [Bradyrhizobium sp. UNPF46]